MHAGTVFRPSLTSQDYSGNLAFRMTRETRRIRQAFGDTDGTCPEPGDSEGGMQEEPGNGGIGYPNARLFSTCTY